MALEIVETPNGSNGDRKNVVSIDMNQACNRCGEPGATRSGFCVSCAGKNMKFDVPLQSHFEDAAEFLLAPELKDIGRKLIKKYDEEFGNISNASFDYFWKKKGGSSGGKNTLGKCQKPSGLLAYYSDTDFVIWLGADTCYGLTEFQITALVFHELKHAFYNPAEDKYEIRPHDFEGFNSEVAIFGNWKSDITQMGNAFRKAEQLKLFV